MDKRQVREIADRVAHALVCESETERTQTLRACIAELIGVENWPAFDCAFVDARNGYELDIMTNGRVEDNGFEEMEEIQ